MRAGILFLFISLSLYLFSCGSRDASSSAQVVNCIQLDSATYQDNYPGVFSNLRSIRKYKLYFRNNCDQVIQIDSILTEDLRLKVHSLKVGNELLSAPIELQPGEQVCIAFSGRNFYNEDGPPVHEVEEYEKSGVDLGENVQLVYRLGGVSLRSDLVKLQALDPVNHP